MVSHDLSDRFLQQTIEDKPKASAYSRWRRYRVAIWCLLGGIASHLPLESGIFDEGDFSVSRGMRLLTREDRTRDKEAVTNERGLRALVERYLPTEEYSP
jgi:hypothetical protein